MKFLLPTLGTIAALATGIAPAQSPGDDQGLQLSWDDSPPVRSGPLAGYSEIVQRVAPSVVAIVVQSRPAPGALGDWPAGSSPMFATEIPGPEDFQADAVGSGVILTSGGYILTSAHVVDEAAEIRVVIPGNDDPLVARLIGADMVTDIAVIKVEAAGLPPAPLAEKPQLAVGDLALTIGNQFGLDHTVTSGIISGLGRKNLTGSAFEDFIQTDAPINPGSSGGALIDTRGRVIGITGAMLADQGRNAGVGFAEPIGSAIEIARGLITRGEISRGSIGAEFSTLTNGLARAFGVASASGAVVSNVTIGSPAERAGLSPGDVVVRFGETEISDPDELERLIAKCDPGSHHRLHAIRFGEALDLSVTVQKLPLADRDAAPQPSLVFEKKALAGIVLADLDAGSRIYFGVPPEIAGVIVVEVDPGSAAARAGINEGDVILQIGRDPVASIGQAVAARKKVDGDEILLRVLSWDGIKFLLLDESKAVGAYSP